MTKLIFITGAFVLFLSIFWLVRKRVFLSFVRIIFGKYSVQYQNYFKKRSLRNPFKHCVRDEILSRVRPLIEGSSKVPHLKTKSKIWFETQPFGSNFGAIVESYGDPSCFNAVKFDNPDFVIKIAGFPSKSLGKGVTALFYFIDDEFFMGEYLVKEETEFLQALNVFLENSFEVDLSTISDKFMIKNTTDQLVYCHNNGFETGAKFLDLESTEIAKLVKQYWKRVDGRQKELATNLTPLLYRS